MDIEYLLSLQEFREAGGQWQAPVMSVLSKMAQYALLIVPILIFWNARRETGYWYLLNMGLSDFVNNLVKMAACVYRPWIREKRIIPWGDAKADATGYSFPSGHTVIATSVLGPVGVRQWKRRKWLSLLCFLLVLLVAFSRNFLGVHTPQDVLAAMAETALVVAFNTWLLRYLHGNEKRQDVWTVIGIGAVIFAVLFYELKPYPMDMADGVLIVNPQDMMKDGYLSVGTMLGFLAGSFWERKKIHFDPSGTWKQRFLRSAIGLIPALLIYLVLRKPMTRLIGIKAGSLISMCMMTFYVVGVYPWCVMRFMKRNHRAEKLI